MASACVNNNMGLFQPDSTNFLDCASSSSCPSYGWFSPRISFSRDLVDEESSSSKLAGTGNGGNGYGGSTGVNSKTQVANDLNSKTQVPIELEKLEIGGGVGGVGDFEFRLEDPVKKMLPADELFSDGKLVPLQLNSVVTAAAGAAPPRLSVTSTGSDEIQSPEMAITRRRVEVSEAELYLFSPKAPRCSSRWKELLGLKKLQKAQNDAHKGSSSSSSSLSSTTRTSNSSSSIKQFLQRNPKSSSSSATDPSLNLPLLRDSDSEIALNGSGSSSSSSSSSSSAPNLEDLPRFSIDSDLKLPNPVSVNSVHRNPPRVRLAKPRTATTEHPNPFSDHHHTARVARSSIHNRAPESNQTQIASRGVSIDSPRMNASGKIVFQSLERSSSSPSTFNGGPRVKHRGVERSYSANVRVTPVLNVPVCSLRGSSKSGGSVFGFFSSSPQKRDGAIRIHSSRTRTTDRN